MLSANEQGLTCSQELRASHIRQRLCSDGVTCLDELLVRSVSTSTTVQRLIPAMDIPEQSAARLQGLSAQQVSCRAWCIASSQTLTRAMLVIYALDLNDFGANAVTLALYGAAASPEVGSDFRLRSHAFSRSHDHLFAPFVFGGAPSASLSQQLSLGSLLLHTSTALHDRLGQAHTQPHKITPRKRR